MMDKYFVRDFIGKSETVSWDRLKAAYMDKEPDASNPTAAAEQTPATSIPNVPVSRDTKVQSSASLTSASITLPPPTT